MKNKIWLYFLALALFVVAPCGVNAASFKINVSCKDVVVNQTSTCTLTATASGAKVSSISARVAVTGNANFVSFQTASGWQGVGDGGRIELYSGTNSSGTFTVGTVTVKGLKAGSATLTVNSVLASDENFEDFATNSGSSRTFKVTAPTTTTTTKKTTKTTTTKKGNNGTTNKTTQPIITTNNNNNSTTPSATPLKLTSLRVDDFAVTYDNGIYYATVSHDTESVEITATAPEGITVIGTGKRTLAEGKNSIELVLRNIQNETATYQLIITRPDEFGIYDTKLTKLKVINYAFDFNPDILEYTVNIPYNVKEIYVLAESYSDDVIITGAGEIILEKGKDVVYVNVSYGDLASTKYVIHIKRNYTMIILYAISGTLGLGLMGALVYAHINKKAAVEKVIASKNKEVAIEKREQIKTAPVADIELNGEKVVGVGKRMVVPTKVVEVRQPEMPIVSPEPQSKSQVQVIKNAPEAQVKVIKKTVIPTQVKTVNTVQSPYQKENIVITDLDK